MDNRRVHYPASFFLNAKAATGASVALVVRDFMNIVVSVSAPANASLTYKFAGAIGDTAPDFTAAQSDTNIYDFIEVADYQDGALIDGDTGVTINNDTAVNNCRMFEANINALDYFAVIVSSYTDGSVSAKVTCTTGV